MKKGILLSSLLIIIFLFSGCNMSNSTTTETLDVSTDDVEYKIVKYQDIKDNPFNYEGEFVEIQERLFIYDNCTEEYSERLYVSPIIEQDTHQIASSNECFTIRYYSSETDEIYNTYKSISADDKPEKLVIKAYGQISITLDQTDWYLTPKKITFYPEINLDNITTEDIQNMADDAKKYRESVLAAKKEKEAELIGNQTLSEDGVNFSELTLVPDKAITVKIDNTTRAAKTGHIVISCLDEDGLQLQELSIRFDISALTNDVIQSSYIPSGTVSVKMLRTVVLDK